MSLHIGYGGAVKKVKAIYAGVGGAVKKVKAVYGGVSNAVKLLWRGDVLERASAPAMTEGKYEPAAAAAGDYAVVLGGGTGSNFRTEDTATAEAYTAELVHVADVASLPEPVYTTTRDSNAASAGNYAIFAGGKRGSWNSFASGEFQNYTYAYDNNLNLNTSVAHVGRYAYMGTAQFAGYAVFGGGQRYGSSYTPHDAAKAYNSNLTVTALADLSEARGFPGAAGAGNVLLFVGGKKRSMADSTAVDIYSANLAAQTPIVLSVPADTQTTIAASVSLGGYALFAGAKSYQGSASKYIYVFNGAVQTTPIELDTPLANCAGTAVGGYAVFAGGCNFGSPYNAQSNVIVLNGDLVQCSAPPLSEARGYLTAVTVGGKAMFFGGTNGSSALGTADAYSAAN